MSNYLVKLTPIDRYFFGGNETFGDGKNTNYFVRSKEFPQQTSLLGMIKKEILIITGVYKEDFKEYREKELENTIGKTFKLSDSNQNHGIINSISPLFLLDNENNIYYKAPLDYGLTFVKSDGKCNFGNTEKEYLPFFENYDAKKGLPNKILSTKILSNRTDYELSEIFKEDVRIGINRKNGEEDGFYKQIFYRLKEGLSFAFVLNIDENNEHAKKFKIENDSHKNVCYIGADSSGFKLEIKEINDPSSYIMKNFTENDIQKGETSSKKFKRLLLVSDTFLKEEDYCEILNLSEFIIGETEKFRNMDTKSNKKSEKYVFLKRSSVIYSKTENSEKIKEKIENGSKCYENLNKIGYNVLKILGE
ncbi:CRISPR-associated TM1793 family protein [Methanococcus vannielii SB]|uniref:CRISPR-associated TM1793 family protein n=1 Tax=Methanococcus vannielii (strain ATCC 35089 / DSM 1224 / JCM 13029 / OCM 148 / SB) TaxID=406327 RepID=A6UNE8_METVS|nr:type III-B CRISPR module-associated protein Cmr3 [Methanococcus vannielii]ABR54020.1 CRISPR-associated TM1793 family protein [Methanococcus vannielii SB]